MRLRAGLKWAVLAPDGKTLAAPGVKAVELWEPDGTLRHALAGSDAATDRPHFADDGRRLVTLGRVEAAGGIEEHVALWDADTGKRLSAFAFRMRSRDDRIVVAPGGGRLATVGGETHVWDTAKGNEFAQPQLAGDRTNCTAFGPGGTTLWTEHAGSIFVFDLAKTNPTKRKDVPSHQFAAVGFHPKVMRFTPDGSKLILSGHDGFVRFWDVKTAKELCRLVGFADGTWAVVDPAGRFDAANGGDVPGLHWVIGGEVVGLDQLKDRDYDPGLLAKHLGFNPEPLLDAKNLDGAKRQPAVAVGEVKAGKAKLTLTDRGGGIGKVVVLVNGKERSADARPAGTAADAKDVTIDLDLKGDPRVEAGKRNRVEVVAYNADGSVASRGAVREFDDAGVPAPAPPTLWAVACGVSHYADPKLNLRYPGKDAEDFAAALKVGGDRLFDGRVNLKVLSESRPAPDKPSRANLLKVLDGLKQSKPGDVVVVYLAGHGVNHAGAEADFYFLSADAASADLAAAADRGRAVSSKALVEALKVVPARKQALILDTCASGKLVEKLTELRGVPGSQVRAMDKLKDRTGVFVLAGCAADAVSYEATRYGQGVLTYSLLLGMRGGAVRDDQVDVGRLFDFAADEVPRLAKDIGGVQRPVVAAPRGGQSYPVGVVTKEDAARIPLQPAKPMFLPSDLFESDATVDQLGLSKLVDEVLRGDARHRGPGAVVFVDAAGLPDGWRIKGGYRVAGDEVALTANVLRGETRVGQIKLAGSKSKLDELADKVIAETRKAVEAADKK